MTGKYRTEPLKLWKKAKELRLKYYEDYARAHERRGLRWAGGAWAFDAIPCGLGEDVWSLTSEPYSASIASNADFSSLCMEAAEKAGYARDVCSYIRNYIGSIILDKYAFPAFSVTWPTPDFIFQSHICCSHAKWYQIVRDIAGEIPYFCIDVSAGPAVVLNEEKRLQYIPIKKHALDYIVNQCLDAIEWLENVTGRRYQDELLRQAIYNHMRTTCMWAKICELQKAIPAPLDEKSMYSLYVLGTLAKSKKWCANFYEELYEEVKERVTRGIAAVANERIRIMSNTQPPWGFLKLFRYLEEYGCVSIGSVYTFGLIGQWDIKEDGTLGARLCPPSIDYIPIDRGEMLEEYIRFEVNRPEWQHFYNSSVKSAMMIKIAREWKVDGVMLHFNRGCEGLSLGISENRMALKKAGLAVVSFEGNMADERENDKMRIIGSIDAFMESLGLRRDFANENK